MARASVQRMKVMYRSWQKRTDLECDNGFWHKGDDTSVQMATVTYKGWQKRTEEDRTSQFKSGLNGMYREYVYEMTGIQSKWHEKAVYLF